MSRFVSTMASIAMVQSAATVSTNQETIAALPTMAIEMSADSSGSGSNATGYTENDPGLDGTENWMAEYEKFFSDQNDYDYQGFIKNLGNDDREKFWNFVRKNVVLE